MRIGFYGAAGEVTGSRHVVDTGNGRIMLDCGLFQGHRKECDRLNRQMPVPPGSVDSVVLSHAHIDHSGNLPTLVKRGYDGMIVSTAATMDLAAVMLPDSAHIQQSDIEYVNRKRERDGLEPLVPLYDKEDVTETMERFMSIPYGRSIEIDGGASLRFLDAGHILGSAQVELTVRERGRDRTVVFTGDLGRSERPILRDPDLSARADVLIMESTYGGRNHEPEGEALGLFGQVLDRTFKRGGKVIIPSFSVDRTQEVLFYINSLLVDGTIPHVPVFVDSPLSFDATEVYKLHPTCYDSETRDLLHSGNGPFQFDGLHFVQSVPESKSLNGMHEPMVIISASGMCENGRILHHLKNNVGNPDNTVLIVGFMARHTLGRRLRDGEREVRIYGEEYTVECDVETVDGFSSHADSDELVEYAATVGGDAEAIVLVHGEPEQQETLAGRIEERLGRRPFVPDRGDVLEL